MSHQQLYANQGDRANTAATLDRVVGSSRSSVRGTAPMGIPADYRAN